MFFKNVKSALGKHRTKFLLNQMRHIAIKHWHVVRKISWSQARNQLGIPGWAKSFLRGALFPTHFPGGRKEI